MKYYFINTANQQEGPIDVHEFASHGVTDQSFVWREGMADWKRAGDCDELKSFFEAPATQIHPSFEEANATTDCNDGVPAPPCHLTAAITGLVLMTIPIPYVALLGGAALGITAIVLNVCAYNFWKKVTTPSCNASTTKHASSQRLPYGWALAPGLSSSRCCSSPWPAPDHSHHFSNGNHYD